MEFSFTTYVERGDDELEVQVTYNLTPFIPATYWQPAEGGEIEIVEALFVADAASMPSPLTDDEYEKLALEAESRAHEDEMNARADRSDYLYDQYRDARMKGNVE